MQPDFCSRSILRSVVRVLQWVVGKKLSLQTNTTNVGSEGGRTWWEYKFVLVLYPLFPDPYKYSPSHPYSSLFLVCPRVLPPGALAPRTWTHVDV